MNRTSSIFPYLKRLSGKLESLSEISGRLVAWLILALVLLVGYDVTMRYLFQSGSVALQELEWHLFALIFLISAAYTFKHDDHVRLDLFYHGSFMNVRRRAWVNILGGLFFLIPFCLLIIISSWPFVQQAFIHAEGSPDPGGLPYRWVLKAAIPAGFFLLLLQGIADVLKNMVALQEQDK
ncbi:MAG TPA: TRAP transporter small permease subunit [Gammaproteobacteria bacterium]|nr:TRAP transporter small permease subunit [Gammaproteobacteria bacterium]